MIDQLYQKTAITDEVIPVWDISRKKDLKFSAGLSEKQ
jgi:hypothetical protein